MGPFLLVIPDTVPTDSCMYRYPVTLNIKPFSCVWVGVSCVKTHSWISTTSQSSQADVGHGAIVPRWSTVARSWNAHIGSILAVVVVVIVPRTRTTVAGHHMAIQYDRGNDDRDDDDESEEYFHGFERSPTFERLFHRLELLETWCELAIRPTSLHDCPLEDHDLFAKPVDNVVELQQRCLATRIQMNAILPLIEIIPQWDIYLIHRPSTIHGAGMGLFYVGEETIPQGAILCYYTGQLLNFRTCRTMHDTSYLMMVLGETFVDARHCLDVKARYINDPLQNETAVNCTFVPMKYRCAVVTSRPVLSGEELFAAYGDYYWTQQR